MSQESFGAPPPPPQEDGTTNANPEEAMILGQETLAESPVVTAPPTEESGTPYVPELAAPASSWATASPDERVAIPRAEVPADVPPLARTVEEANMNTDSVMRISAEDLTRAAAAEATIEEEELAPDREVLLDTGEIEADIAGLTAREKDLTAEEKARLTGLRWLLGETGSKKKSVAKAPHLDTGGGETPVDIVLEGDAAGTEGAKEKNESREKVRGDIAFEYGERFGITGEELASIEGFGELSPGQQRMVFENLSQITLGRIHEDAKDTINELSEKQKKEAKFAGKIWLGLKESFGAKKIALARKEKDLVAELEEGGIAPHKEALTQLVKGMKELGPKVVEREDGGLSTLYLESDGLPPEKAMRIGEFNSVAARFAEVPYEWSLETATKSQRAAYAEAKELFEGAKKDALSILGEAGGKDGAMRVMAGIESQLNAERFLTTAPNAAEELKNIEEQSVWTNALRSTVAERGAYFLLGAATRSAVGLVAGGASGVLGGTLAGGVVGAMRGYMKSRDTLRSQDLDMRQGKEVKADMEATAKNMIEADTGAKKIEYLIDKIANYDESAKNARTKEELIDALKQRIDYSSQKISEGKVIFGEADDRLANQYRLTSALAKAHAFIGADSAKNERGEKLRDRLDSLLEKTDDKIRGARRNYTIKETTKTAAIGAGFAAVGAIATDALQWMNGSQKTAMEKAFGAYDEANAAALEKTAAAEAGIAAEAGEEGLAPMGAEEIVRASDEARAALEGTYGVEGANIHEVVRGDTLWKISGGNPAVMRLSPEELRSLNISSGDPNVIKIGEKIDVSRLNELLGQKAALAEEIRRVAPNAMAEPASVPVAGVSRSPLDPLEATDLNNDPYAENAPLSRAAPVEGSPASTPPPAETLPEAADAPVSSTEAPKVKEVSSETLTESAPQKVPPKEAFPTGKGYRIEGDTVVPERTLSEMSPAELARMPKHLPRPWPMSAEEAERSFGGSLSPERQLAERVKLEIGRYPNSDELSFAKIVETRAGGDGKFFARELENIRNSPMSRAETETAIRRLGGSRAQSAVDAQRGGSEWGNRRPLRSRDQGNFARGDEYQTRPSGSRPGASPAGRYSSDVQREYSRYGEKVTRARAQYITDKILGRENAGTRYERTTAAAGRALERGTERARERAVTGVVRSIFGGR